LESFPLLAVIPLIADNRLIGVLQLFSDQTLHDRLIEEEKVLLTLAAHSTVSLSNALYYNELGEKAQLQAELKAAQSIQQRLTPRFSPDIPGIHLKGLYSPAYEVGGDYLDYFKNDVGCWVVVIADVCGKGIPAALLMTLLRSAFRVESRTETSAKRLLCSVNNSMQVNLDDRSFVTAICLIIRPDGKSMTYARAGHPRLLKIVPTNHQVDTYRSDGIALGILPDADSFSAAIDELTIVLVPGDHFFIYTDGLTEAFDPKKNTYGTERLMNVLSEYGGSTPEQLIDTIIKDIKSFTQGAPYHDDLTLIAFSVDQ
jgi:sigma-B regulation protein RsbU (phosphoserine phosphatase)